MTRAGLDRYLGVLGQGRICAGCHAASRVAVGGTGWDGDTFKTKILMDKYGIQINKTSRNTILFMTNIGTTRSSVAYLIEVLVEIAQRS